MVIKVLGSGCSKCKKLEENVRKAVAELGWKVEQHSDAAKHEADDSEVSKSYVSVEKVTDLKTIMSYGVMSTPALVVDEKVVSAGKLLSASDIVRLIS